MIKSLCLLVIAATLQMRGETPLSNANNEREPDRSCRQGTDATIVFWQEIERGERPVERSNMVCTPQAVAEPVERAGAGAGR